MVVRTEVKAEFLSLISPLSTDEPAFCISTTPLKAFNFSLLAEVEISNPVMVIGITNTYVENQSSGVIVFFRVYISVAVRVIVFFRPELAVVQVKLNASHAAL